MKILLILILITPLSFAQQTDNILTRFIEHNVAGELTATLRDPQARAALIRRMEALAVVYENRANSCEQDIGSLNQDLTAPQRADDILDNNTFLLVNDIHRHLNITLQRNIAWWDSRPNYNNYNCSFMLEREGLNNLPRTFGLQIQTGPLRNRICSNYDRMIQCFQSAEDILMDEELLINQSPRYYQMEHFDRTFVEEHFSASVSE